MMPLVASGCQVRGMQGGGGGRYLGVWPTTTTQQTVCLGVAQQSSALFSDLLGAWPGYQRRCDQYLARGCPPRASIGSTKKISSAAAATNGRTASSSNVASISIAMRTSRDSLA
jgi:hypothetical protein